MRAEDAIHHSSAWFIAAEAFVSVHTFLNTRFVNTVYGEESFPSKEAVAGFPRPGANTVLAPPAQPVDGSIDAKNELGIKGRRKLTRALQSPACSCF